MRNLSIVVVVTLLTLPALAQQRTAGITFELEDVRMTSAFEMWSARTGVQLVINWKALEEDGIDVDRPITMSLRDVHPATVLDLLMQYCSGDGYSTLVVEPHATFAHVTTRRQALRRPVLRVYHVRDMTMDIPHFTDAPGFSLTDALSNTRSGGGGSGGGSGGQGLFGTQNQQAQPAARTQQERGEELAQLIRETVEPDIWVENGGEFASIRYFDGRLIVRAPLYVHGIVRQRL